MRVGGGARSVLEHTSVSAVESGGGGQQRVGKQRAGIGSAVQGGAVGVEEQGTAMARAAAVLVLELSGKGDGGVCEELPAGGCDDIVDDDEYDGG